jgi:hypothetical protein
MNNQSSWNSTNVSKPRNDLTRNSGLLKSPTRHYLPENAPTRKQKPYRRFRRETLWREIQKFDRLEGEMSEHETLCVRARRWLSGTRQCNPVFSNIASCGEIPDAIGWSSRYQWAGSTVIECKTSVSDFYADKKKRFLWRHIEHKWRTAYPRLTKKEAAESGYVLEEVPTMGDYRFYFCDAVILSEELISTHAPDHGLLWLSGRRIRLIRNAPKRENVDKDGEIRYLRFAIINCKKPHIEEAIEPQQLQLVAS